MGGPKIYFSLVIWLLLAVPAPACMWDYDTTWLIIDKRFSRVAVLAITDTD